jgi:hypothetical protein
MARFADPVRTYSQDQHKWKEIEQGHQAYRWHHHEVGRLTKKDVVMDVLEHGIGEREISRLLHVCSDLDHLKHLQRRRLCHSSELDIP